MMASTRTCKLAVLGVLALAACAPSTQGRPAVSPEPSQQLENIHIETQGTGSQPAIFSAQSHNRRIYLVRAKSSVGDRLGDGSFVVVLSQPRVTFFDKDGKTLVGDAPKAVVTERNKTVFMSGGVTARTQDGAILTCDTMTYDGNTERIHGEKDVVLTSPDGDRLSGDTIDADVRLNHVTVSGNR
jgi:LPS export ABC transporter protein LptC